MPFPSFRDLFWRNSHDDEPVKSRAEMATGRTQRHAMKAAQTNFNLRQFLDPTSRTKYARLSQDSTYPSNTQMVGFEALLLGTVSCANPLTPTVSPSTRICTNNTLEESHSYSHHHCSSTPTVPDTVNGSHRSFEALPVLQSTATGGSHQQQWPNQRQFERTYVLSRV